MPPPHDAPSITAYRERLSALLGTVGKVSEIVPADAHCVGRVLAEAVAAATPIPPFVSSAMDGYAVRLLEQATAESVVGQVFSVVDEVLAGDVSRVFVDGAELRSGEAVRIMTGAAIPPGADTVIPVECTDAAPTGLAPARVTVTRAVEAARHVRAVGEELGAGEVLAAAGQLVTPGLLAVVLSAGIATLACVRPLRVAVISTGTELTKPGTAPAQGAIFESNGAMLSALLTSFGCQVVWAESCGDDPDAFRGLLDRAASDAELIVTTGGVSQGAAEVVRQVLDEVGEFVHLAMRPGGPQGSAVWRQTPAFCLPGTPAGAFVGAHVLIRPVLAAWSGTAVPGPTRASWLGSTRTFRTGHTHFVTAHLDLSATSGPAVQDVPGRAMRALASADAIVEVGPELRELHDGDRVPVWPLR